MHDTLPSPGPEVGTVGVALRLWGWYVNVTPPGAPASGSSLADRNGLVREHKRLEVEGFDPKVENAEQLHRRLAYVLDM